jgi:DNA-binding NarL/FixJ family response regulator
VRALLSSTGDIEVVGEAGDGLETIRRVQETTPDVVLMDIAMPGLGGLEATLELRKLSPRTRILVLTQYDNKEYILRFLRAGAAGYMLKTAVSSELAAAIRTVHQGGLYLKAPEAPNLIRQALQGEGEGRETGYESLSDREKQVLRLIAEGNTSKQIAEMLSISVKTVIAHRTNLMQKLGIHNRVQLINFAIAHGLVQLPAPGRVDEAEK